MRGSAFLEIRSPHQKKRRACETRFVIILAFCRDIVNLYGYPSGKIIAAIPHRQRIGGNFHMAGHAEWESELAHGACRPLIAYESFALSSEELGVRS